MLPLLHTDDPNLYLSSPPQIEKFPWYYMQPCQVLVGVYGSGPLKSMPKAAYIGYEFEVSVGVDSLELAAEIRVKVETAIWHQHTPLPAKLMRAGIATLMAITTGGAFGYVMRYKVSP